MKAPKMIMKTTLSTAAKGFAALALSTAVLMAPSVHAAGDAAVERQKVMGHVGAATGAGAAIAKGQVPFDAVQAQLILRHMNAAGHGFGYMFPKGSETGAKTEASPKIWEDRAGFDAQVNKFIEASAVLPTDLDGFKAAFGAVTATCGTCHRAYRVKN